MRRSVILMAIGLMFVVADAAQATPLLVSGSGTSSAGNPIAASASFDVSGTNLIIVRNNDSTANGSHVPNDGLFFTVRAVRREGWDINLKKTHRIYRELGLQLRNKTPKRRVKAKLREDRRDATQPNETWAMDFVHDQLASGKKIRVLTVVDTFSRYAPAIDPRFTYRGEDVVHTLEKICSETGYPSSIRVDQGSEFVSRDLDLWAYANGVTLDFSRPGKPTDNAFIEAFNGRFRAECLNAHWFMCLEDAREKMEDWRKYYNEVRPHGAIGQKVPIALLNRDGAASPPP